MHIIAQAHKRMKQGAYREEHLGPMLTVQVAERVHFRGRISDEELRRLLSEATVFAMPSIAELQSLATIEGMARGLPVVVADAMALPHLVRDGVNGYLFTPRDVGVLAERLHHHL